LKKTGDSGHPCLTPWVCDMLLIDKISLVHFPFKIIKNYCSPFRGQ